jgi:hypothetical protein
MKSELQFSASIRYKVPKENMDAELQMVVDHVCELIHGDPTRQVEISLRNIETLESQVVVQFDRRCDDFAEFPDVFFDGVYEKLKNSPLCYLEVNFPDVDYFMVLSNLKIIADKIYSSVNVTHLQYEDYANN